MSPRLRHTCDLIIEYGTYLYVFALFNQGTTALSRIGIYLPLIAWVVKHLATRGRELGYLKHPLAGTALAFFGLVFIATAQAPDVLLSMDSYRKNLGQALFLLLVIGDIFRQRQRQQRLLQVVLCSGIYINGLHLWKIYQVHQHSGIWQLFPTDAGLYRDYANALGFFLPFTFYWMLRPRNRLTWALSALLLLQLLLLGSTGARGAWLGAAAGLLLWLALSFSRRLLLVCVAGGLILGTVGLLGGHNIISERLRSGWTSNNRVSMIWQPTVRMIQEKPLTGHGFGNQLFIDQLRQRHPDSPVLALGPLLSTHSNYLQIGFAAGVLALLALLALYGQLLWYPLQRLRRHPDHALLAVTCAFLGTMLLRGLVENMRWAPFGVLLGLALALLLTPRDDAR